MCVRMLGVYARVRLNAGLLLTVRVRLRVLARGREDVGVSECEGVSVPSAVWHTSMRQ